MKPSTDRGAPPPPAPPAERIVTLEIIADADSTTLVVPAGALLVLQTIGLGAQLQIVLGVRRDLLVLTSPPALRDLQLAGHLGHHAVTSLRAVGAQTYAARASLVLTPPDWGRYRVEFVFGRFLALGELPPEHRNYTLH